jgi:hypothetical protein
MALKKDSAGRTLDRESHPAQVGVTKTYGPTSRQTEDAFCVGHAPGKGFRLNPEFDHSK